MRTEKELAAEALAVQDACNLSGVVRAWARATEDLWAAAGDRGTDWVNTHPVSKLFADKLADMVRRDGKDVESAYAWARKQVDGHGQ